jgi:hypothetical protein
MRFTELKGGGEHRQGSHWQFSSTFGSPITYTGRPAAEKQQLNVFSLEHFLPAVVNNSDLQTSFIMAEQKLHVIIVGAGMNTPPMLSSKC